MVKAVCRILFIGACCITVCYAQNSGSRRPITNNNPSVNGIGPLPLAKEAVDPLPANGRDNNRVLSEPNGNVASLTNARSYTWLLDFSGYQLEIIKPTVHIVKGPPLQIGKLKIFDVRADPNKIGFKPVDYAKQKKGVGTIGLEVSDGFQKWLQEEVLNKYIQLDSSSNRQLVVVINKCWLTNDASIPYTGARPKLTNTLQYNINLYSSLGNGYFPLKKLEGSFTQLYEAKQKEFPLFDSLAQLLCKEISLLHFSDTEKEEKLVSIRDFNIFYTAQKNLLSNIISPVKGMYKTYEDFLIQKVSGDSVEFIKKYDNYGRAPFYACELMQFTDQDPASTSKNWGYADGKSLYVNIGNGFFVRLVKSGGNYIFYWLNNMREERIKSSVSRGIILGNSSFEIIKDYSRVTPLTYQLDPLTGKLY